MGKTYTFHIDGVVLETLPMKRLARYMDGLAGLFGYPESVHFHSVDTGSVNLVAQVDDGRADQVEERIARINQGTGSQADRKALQKVTRLLEEDGASGSIYEGRDRTLPVLELPKDGRTRAVAYGPFKQEDSIQGKVTSIILGKHKATLQMQNGNLKYKNIEADAEIAYLIAEHMREPIRILGIGSWLRNENGKWELNNFRVSEFKVLEDVDLKEAVRRLQDIKGSYWKEMDDPIGVIKNLRGKGDDLN